MIKSVLINVLLLIAVLSMVRAGTPPKPNPSKSFSSFFLETIDGESKFFRYYSDFPNVKAKLASRDETNLFKCGNEQTWVTWEKFSQCSVVCINGFPNCDGSGEACTCALGDPWFPLNDATYDGTCSSFIGVPGQLWTNQAFGFSYCFKGNKPLYIETPFSRLDYFLFIPRAPRSFIFTVPPSCCPNKKARLFEEPQSPAHKQQRRSVKSPSGKSSKVHAPSALKPHSIAQKRDETSGNKEGIDYKGPIYSLFNIDP